VAGGGKLVKAELNHDHPPLTRAMRIGAPPSHQLGKHYRIGRKSAYPIHQESENGAPAALREPLVRSAGLPARNNQAARASACWRANSSRASTPCRAAGRSPPSPPSPFPAIGAASKGLTWTVFLLLANQFAVAAAMLNTAEGETTAGFTQGALYQWHKSVGLVVLAAALLRYVWRKTTPLPDWAPNLSAGEKRWIPRIETVLYCCMFLMPVSGYVFVMAGGYGVNFFGQWNLPNYLGKHAAPLSIEFQSGIVSRSSIERSRPASASFWISAGVPPNPACASQFACGS